MTVLVTGGAGYIGSHTCVELLNAGYEVVVVDNFINSKEEVVQKIEKITHKTFKCYKGSIGNKVLLERVFEENKIEVVIHFAALKAVGESVQKPLTYYDNNISMGLVLLEVMEKYNVKKLVFSSSATVYGEPETVPIKEDFKTSVTNPYGSTKLMFENILKDMYKADTSWHIVILRYFNPIGAHESGLLGENPKSRPNNLVPYIAQVALGRLEAVYIFGDDYNTKDGTGVRDYIHVVDLARGHIKALEKVMKASGIDIYNLGTGRGYSVLEVINAFKKASGREIQYEIIGRRKGDIGLCYADTEKANKILHWRATKSLMEMCEDMWHFATLQWGEVNE